MCKVFLKTYFLLDFRKKAKKAVKIHKIDSPFLIFMESTTFKVPSILLKTMSATNNNNTAVENTVKEKKPALSGKYSKFMIFGYSFVQSLHGEGVLTDEGLEAAYSQLKMFDSVDSQTDFYEQILEQSKASGVVMRKLIRQRNAPPKAPKEKKARKPRAKKEEAAGADAPAAVDASGAEAPKEKKARKPRAKKTTNVVQDANNDLIAEIVAAANENPLDAAVAPAEAKEEAPKEKKARKPRAKKTEEKKEEVPATPNASEAKDVAAPKKASKPRTKKADEKKEEAPVANLTAVMDAAAEELEEEDVVTQEIIIGGTTYLIDEENNLYSVDTHEEMGTYNPETQEISRDL
jgi:hypothetical protein